MPHSVLPHCKMHFWLTAAFPYMPSRVGRGDRTNKQEILSWFYPRLPGKVRALSSSNWTNLSKIFMGYEAVGLSSIFPLNFPHCFVNICFHQLASTLPFLLERVKFPTRFPFPLSLFCNMQSSVVWLFSPGDPRWPRIQISHDGWVSACLLHCSPPTKQMREKGTCVHFVPALVWGLITILSTGWHI